MRRVGSIVGAVSFFVAASGSGALAATVLYPPGENPNHAVSVRQAAYERPLIAVAHRGASGHAPENTLSAIDAADRLNAETVEVDVQLTADGEPVLMHDTTLTRTTNAEEVFPDRDPYRVGDFTLDEIQQLEAGGWFADSFEGEPVPSLGEALDRLELLDLNLFLEVKEPALYPGIEERVAEEFYQRTRWFEHSIPWEPRRLVVQSFDWDSLHESKTLLPSVPHALLGKVDEDQIAEYDWAHMINPNYTTIDADYVDRVQEAGLEIMPFTINEREDMDSVLDMGVDGFISDFPDIGQEAIADAVAEREPHSDAADVTEPQVEAEDLDGAEVDAEAQADATGDPASGPARGPAVPSSH